MADLSCVEFGRRLLELDDLDPVYVAVWNAGFDRELTRKWLLAYWCFYHVGTASWVAAASSEERYWDRMRAAAGSKAYPRSRERRHFRGDNAAKSVAWLSAAGLDALYDGFPRPAPGAADVIEYVTEWVGFGPWVAFKVADMLERLGLLDVRFDADTVLYDSPRKAAAVLYEEEKGVADVRGESGKWALTSLVSRLSRFTAPPRHDRRIGFQEAETVLCKWLSYRNGHYRLGEDVEALGAGLARFPCAGPSRLLEAGATRGGLW